MGTCSRATSFNMLSPFFCDPKEVMVIGNRAHQSVFMEPADAAEVYTWPTMLSLTIGTYVRFQPRSAGFQEEVGEGVELQASMFTHSTLTQGEWVQVSHAGTLHDLKVLALKPEAAVSIIGEHTVSLCTRCLYVTCHTHRSHGHKPFWEEQEWSWAYLSRECVLAVVGAGRSLSSVP